MQRKKYTPEFKAQVVKEAMETGNTSIVARRYELNSNMVCRWVREIKKQGQSQIPASTSTAEVKHIKSENEQLKKLVGEKELENQILRDLLKKNQPSLTDKIEIAHKYISQGHPAVWVLSIVGVSRSTYYYRIKNKDKTRKPSGGRPIPGYSRTKDGRKVADKQIKEWLLQFIENEGYAYGYMKLTIALRKHRNLVINKKKVYRLCKELNILRPQRKIKPKHPKKITRNRTITTSKTMWEVDIKYGFIHGEDRFFFILSYIDVFDRSIVDYHMGLSCTAQDAVTTLKRALLKRELFGSNEKPVIRSDNGPQFVSRIFGDTCLEYGIEHERIPYKSPNLNAHIESYHSILEDECLSRYSFSNYAEAYEVVAEFVKFYNTRRIHRSILGLSPVEYYKAVNQNMVKAIEVRV